MKKVSLSTVIFEIVVALKLFSWGQERTETFK